MTNAGPGGATEMPSTFMFLATFRRNQMGVGATSAMMMLMTVAAIIIPYPSLRCARDHEHGSG